MNRTREDGGRTRALDGLLRVRSLTEALQWARFRWRHRGRRPIVVIHQMARVGSITVHRALRRHVPGIDLYHTHYLSAEAIARQRAQFDRIYRVTGRAGLHREYLAARLLRRRLGDRGRERWRVITLVRDPVARTVSAFFRHFPFAFPELGVPYLEDPANAPALLERFTRDAESEASFTLDWFDREVEAVLGIDVYATPFPHEAGTITLPGPAADLLVIRLEDLDRAGPAALGAFLGAPPVPLEARNRSDEESYRETWRRFRTTFVPEPGFLDRMYGSRLARHFYRPDELAAFRARWERPAGG